MGVTEDFAGFPFQEFLLFLAEKSPACRYYDIKKDLTLTGISGSPRRRHRLGTKRERLWFTQWITGSSTSSQRFGKHVLLWPGQESHQIW